MKKDESQLLDAFGRQAKSHWKKFRPKMYAELKKNGQLLPVLLSLQERVAKQYSDHIDRGLQHHKAWELVQDQVLLPSEDDVPNLGEKDG